MVLGFGDQLLGDHFAGGAELGGDAVVCCVQVFVGLDGAFQFLADQQGLADHDERFAEVQAQIAFLSQGHAATDHVELVGHQRRDDAVVTGGNQFQLDAHGLGHGFEDIDFEADDFAALVGHFERHVGRIHTDFQRAALDRVIDRTGLRRIDCNQCRDADQQHRQILLHLQVPKTIAFAARKPTVTGKKARVRQFGDGC
ncbi:hypothetical protein D3C72_1139230 [compost metagenome]